MLTSLAATLEELIGIQKQLLDFAEQKRIVLIERKVDELNGLVKEEAKLVKQLNLAENGREQLAAQLRQEHPDLTFSEFVAQLPPVPAFARWAGDKGVSEYPFVSGLRKPAEAVPVHCTRP